MTQPRPVRAAAGAGQIGAGVAAHAFASGCLPSAASLAVALPLALVGVVLLARMFPHRPLARLAGGQFAVHAALTVSAACAGAHSPHLLMTYAHVAVVLVLRVGWDRVTQVLDDAARAAGRLVPRLRLALPAAPVAAPTIVPAAVPAAPRRLLLPAPTGRRGPPAGRLVLSPA
ncbi:MAG: hypothetical protein H7233_11665 [Pseudorhodobacter sp.]|nr:hypothetical protein [Frankiaceae bacterium]